MLLESGGLTPGREAAEARRSGPRRARGAADAYPVRRPVVRRAAGRTPVSDIETGGAHPRAPAAPPRVGAVERAEDWGEAPDILGFVGRVTSWRCCAAGWWMSDVG